MKNTFPFHTQLHFHSFSQVKRTMTLHCRWHCPGDQNVCDKRSKKQHSHLQAQSQNMYNTGTPNRKHIPWCLSQPSHICMIRAVEVELSHCVSEYHSLRSLPPKNIYLWRILFHFTLNFIFIVSAKLNERWHYIADDTALVIKMFDNVREIITAEGKNYDLPNKQVIFSLNSPASIGQPGNPISAALI